MIIVGFDPGLATLGYGVIEKDNKGKISVIDYGIVQTPKGESLSVRLCMLEEATKQIIDKFKPDEISMEELFFAKNVKTAINVAHARGVLLLTCNKVCGRIFEYTPLQIKQALTGYGRADKKQIQKMVQTLLKLKEIPKPDDAADALAVALTHARTNKLGEQFII
ncbi:MAG: crossover junction endodeoxyribonuclease RuvC [Firmicutes bacterium]|nr:crossover junction endodeoxyribonuclease RuvC [Candidatus Caballimonas caccae]